MACPRIVRIITEGPPGPQGIPGPPGEDTTVTPEQFGAENDGVSLDDEAFDLAYNFVMNLPNGGRIVLLPGPGYLLAAEHNIHPAKRLEIEWLAGAKVLCELEGASKVLFNADHPAVEGTRGKSLTIVSSVIDFHSDFPTSKIGGCFFQYRYASEFAFMGRSTWTHYRNNTAIRVAAPWNCDTSRLSIYGAGASGFIRKITTATFAVSGIDMTASAPVFGATDAGQSMILFEPTSGNYELVTLAGPAADSTHATLTAAPALVHTASGGGFMGVKAATTAASATIVLETACASSVDVGRFIYVFNGKNLTFGGARKGLLRAKILAVNIDGKTLTLDTPVDFTMAATYVAISPSVELFLETGFNGLTNDMSFTGLRTEQYRGTGVVVMGGSNIIFDKLKIHGTRAQDGTQNTFSLLVDNCVTRITHGEFEGAAAHNDLGMIHVSGVYAGFSIEEGQGAIALNQPLLYAENNGASAIIEVGSFSFANPGLTSKMLDNILKSDGNGKVYRRGRFSATGLVYVPVGFPPGIRGEIDFAQFTPTAEFSDAGDNSFVPDYTGGTQRGIYSIRNGRLFGTVELVFSTNAYNVAAYSGLSFQVNLGSTIPLRPGLGSVSFAIGRHQKFVNVAAGNQCGYILVATRVVKFFTNVSGALGTFWTPAQVPASTSALRLEFEFNYELQLA